MHEIIKFMQNCKRKRILSNIRFQHNKRLITRFYGSLRTIKRSIIVHFYNFLFCCFSDFHGQKGSSTVFLYSSTFKNCQKFNFSSLIDVRTSNLANILCFRCANLNRTNSLLRKMSATGFKYNQGVKPHFS